MTEAARVLAELGFTGLEAEIYAFLVRESPATGYRIAQAINKPVANTYKAIQTLHEKGGIEVEDGDTRLCRAVPPEELLERLGREFESRRSQARDLLGKLGKASGDERVYQIRSRSQALQRAREMLGSAKEVVLVCAPEALAFELSEPLAGAAARGVKVQVKADAELAIAKVETFVAARGEDLVTSAGFLRLVVDGEQSLTAHLEGGRATAVYSRNPALALPMHEGIAAEITLLSVLEKVEEGAGAKRIARAMEVTPPATETLGFGRL